MQSNSSQCLLCQEPQLSIQYIGLCYTLTYIRTLVSASLYRYTYYVGEVPSVNCKLNAITNFSTLVPYYGGGGGRGQD